MTASEGPRVRRRQLRKAAILLVAAGALVQILLSAYYLGVGHAPAPHHLPVGFVATSDTSVQVQALALGGDERVDRSRPNRRAHSAFGSTRRRSTW